MYYVCVIICRYNFPEVSVCDSGGILFRTATQFRPTVDRQRGSQKTGPIERPDLRSARSSVRKNRSLIGAQRIIGLDLRHQP